jgi:hypothetical protein
MRRQLGVAVAHLREWQIDRIRHVPTGELVGLAHVDQQCSPHWRISETG